MVDEQSKPKPPTRHFFRKAVAPPPKIRRPKHKGKIVMVQLGSGQTTIMASGKVASQIGSSKGGLTSAARGVAHRWTPEEARKARLRSLGKLCKRIGVRVGMRSKRRPQVKRAPLRQLHSYPNVVEGIWYDLQQKTWFTRNTAYNSPLDQTVYGRTLSERAALTRLGYLPSKRKGFVPTSTTKIQPITRKKRG